MELKKLSYSYLHTLSCTYQTFLRYEGRLRGDTTHYLALGNAVHLALEKMYGPGPTYSVVLNLEQTIKAFMIEFSRIIKDDDVFVSYPQLKKAEAEGTEMIQRYFKQMEKGLISKTPFAVEAAFEIPISGILLIGKIDKVEKTSEGLTLIDYKTGQKKPDDWFLGRGYQFSAYALACKEIYGEYPTKIIWHHLRTGTFIETVRSEWDIDNLKHIIETAITLNKHDIRFRVYHEKVCEWCPFSGKGGACDDKELEQEILTKRQLKVIQPAITE